MDGNFTKLHLSKIVGAACKKIKNRKVAYLNRINKFEISFRENMLAKIQTVNSAVFRKCLKNQNT